MARPEFIRRLIVNADDFGRSHSINDAVLRAHRQGILTSASLMVNEPAADEALRVARDNPGLGVGLHLVLVCGRAALPHSAIPQLSDSANNFPANPVSAGMRYFFSRRLRGQLRDEMAAQFDRFHQSGLRLDHVNGHLNIHLHPVILDLLMEQAANWGVTHLRVTDDPFGLNRRLASGKWCYRAGHAFIYRILSARARPALKRANIRCAQRVFGLLQYARMDEAFLLKLLPKLPPGDSELYSHPSLDDFKHEFFALISPRVAERVAQLGIRLVRYQDL